MTIILSILLSLSVLNADDGKTIIVTSPDGRVRLEKPYDSRFPPRLIEAATGKILHTFPLDADLYSFAFRADGQKLAMMPKLDNLGTQLMNNRSTKAKPVYIYDLVSNATEELHFGELVLPRGDAVKNSAYPILEWNSDGKYISVDIEAGDSIGLILDSKNGEVVSQFGRISGRIAAEAALPSDVTWDFYAPISKRAWHDFEGRPISSMAWNPKNPSILAVGYKDGKVVLVDVDKLNSDAKNSRVDISGLIKKVSAETSESSQDLYFEAQHKRLKWSPDGRYLVTVQNSDFTYNYGPQRHAVVSIFDSATATVIKRVTVSQTLEKANDWRTDVFTVNWSDSGRLSVTDLKGQEKLNLKFELGQGAKSDICELALSKIGYIQRLIQKTLYKF